MKREEGKEHLLNTCYVPGTGLSAGDKNTKIKTAPVLKEFAFKLRYNKLPCRKEEGGPKTLFLQRSFFSSLY